jgi:hypothetical protein
MDRDKRPVDTIQYQLIDDADEPLLFRSGYAGSPFPDGHRCLLCPRDTLVFRPAAF